MTTSSHISTAKLYLISDFPIDDEQLRTIRRLYGEQTSDAELVFHSDRKICEWPLHVPHEFGPINAVDFHIYLCAGFL